MALALAGNSPDGGLGGVQRRRKWALLSSIVLAVAFLAVTSSSWDVGSSLIYESIEWIGMILILICVAGRTWCSLYIGGRKKAELVELGPYSIVRNPLYVFTLIGAVGVGFQTGSLIVGAICAFATYVIFRRVVVREEAFLAGAFPEAFPIYAARVPRLWPKLSLWVDTDMFVVAPRPVIRTFADTSLFLIAIPLAEMIDALQAGGSLPILFNLP